MHHSKKQFALNVASGWMAQVVFAAAGFFLTPYILRGLGEQGFGVYQLACSSIVFFMFLQLGMGPTLIRFFAKAIAKKNSGEIRGISSSAQLLLGGLGLLAASLFFALIPFFIRFYVIPSALRSDTIGLLVCMSVSIFLNMIVIVPQGLVLGLNRYELSNGVQIVSYLLRVLTVVFLFECFHPSVFFVGLAILVAALWQFSALFFISVKHLKYAAVFSFKCIRNDVLRHLLGFSMLNLMNSVAAAFVFQGPMLIIGKILGPQMVAAYAPAIVISIAMQGLLGQIARPLVPIASKDVESKGGASLGKWAITMGQFVAIIGFGMVLPVVVFGPELMRFWLGKDLMWIWSIVAVLSSGVAISQIQAVNYFLALGGGNIKPTVYSQIVMAFVVSTGTLIGLAFFKWSLFAVALFIGICIFIRNTFYLSYAYSKQFCYSYLLYMWWVYIVPALVMALCIVEGWGLKWILPSNNLWLLAMKAGIVLGSYCVCAWVILIPRTIKQWIIEMILRFSPVKFTRAALP